MGRSGHCAAVVLGVWLVASAAPSAGAADPAFQKWVADLWPQAQALGVSRATFEAATRGLEVLFHVVPPEPEDTSPGARVPSRQLSRVVDRGLIRIAVTAARSGSGNM